MDLLVVPTMMLVKFLKNYVRIIQLLVPLSRNQIIAKNLKQTLYHQFNVIMLIMETIVLIRIVILISINNILAMLKNVPKHHLIINSPI